MMKFNASEKEITLAVLFLVVLLLLHNAFNIGVVKHNDEKYYQKIDSLQVKIDSLTILNKELDKKIMESNQIILRIDDEINQVDKTINIVKKQTNEKVSNVDNFTYNDLEVFFANRYK